ncbi:MAG: hypothetical protein ABIZ80_14815 [Bryobacteraceae bacterium]
MRRPCSALLFAFVFAELGAMGQIGSPYPGGGYPPGRTPGTGSPGMGLPRIGKKKKDSKQQKGEPEQLVTVTGVLRQMDAQQIIVEAQDTRVINLKRSENTRFLKDGDDIKPLDLKPGDHLMIEANQDAEGFLFAVNVMLQKAGTASERAAASQPVAHVSTQAAPSDDERPVLRRKDDKPAAAAASPAAPGTPPVAPAQPDEDAEPARTGRATVVRDSELPHSYDPDDNGPPKLRRGIPKKQKRSAPVEVARAGPPPVAREREAAPEREPVRERAAVEEPAAPRKEDPFIVKAREMATTFTETLPNYVCQQVTARFLNRSHITSWQALDVITAEVIYENGQEHYRNLAINGKPTKKNMEEMGGSWSKGEFGTVLRDLFSPATAAEFRFRRESTTAGLASRMYDFQVEREGSHWHIQVASQSVMPAYKGSVWIEKSTGRVLRIEMQTRNMPSEFPMDKVESASDYEYIRIGGTQQFLLPVHAETLSCQRGTNVCSRNSIDFRNYHKYSGEANITF